MPQLDYFACRQASIRAFRDSREHEEFRPPARVRTGPPLNPGRSSTGKPVRRVPGSDKSPAPSVRNGSAVTVNAAHAIGRSAKEDIAEKGTITIRTSRDGEWAEVRIGDTGTGIPEEIRDRIFDPFFTTKEVGKGTGQGLAIAHSVEVNKHRGTIAFETAEGEGTCALPQLVRCENIEIFGAVPESARLIR